MIASWIKRLTQKRDRYTIGCIDFGTAFSKVAIVASEDTEDLLAEDVVPLAIGEGIAANPYLLPSLLFVSDTHVLFGKAAEAAARRAEAQARMAFMSPKQRLSTHDIDSLDAPLETEIDPTGQYNAADLITAYLAFLLIRAEAAAKASRTDWPPKLRIARPAWEEKRAQWGEATLRTLVRHAFILADRIGSSLMSDAGVPHPELKVALSEIPDTKSFPDTDIFQIGPDGFATVPEATAVGASAIRATGRRVVVVADIGGGTSDFAAFMTGVKGKKVLAEISGSARVLRQAGDYLDMHLRRLMLASAGLLHDDPAARGAMAQLKSRQRALKETLMVEGRVVLDVGDAILELDRDTFLQDEHVKGFSRRLSDTFLECVRVAVPVAQTYSTGSRRTPVDILATGGGYDLPMVQAMIRDIPIDWEFRVMVPDVFEELDPPVAAVFRQLAVSIGGAMKDLPKAVRPV